MADQLDMFGGPDLIGELMAHAQALVRIRARLRRADMEAEHEADKREEFQASQRGEVRGYAARGYRLNYCPIGPLHPAYSPPNRRKMRLRVAIEDADRMDPRRSHREFLRLMRLREQEGA